MFKTGVKYSEIWNIAYPIILGSIAQNLLNVTDTAFLGRVGEVELGAGAIGGIYYFVVIMLAWGFGIGLQIIVARRNGEASYTEIGRTIDHGVYFLIPLALLMFALMKFFSGSILQNVVTSEEVLNATIDFINYRSFGIFFAFTNILFRAFYVGVAQTRVITFTTLIMAIINAFLDYCLIFGNFGFPEMGISGAALASVIAESSATAFFMLYSKYLYRTSKYNLFHFKAFDLKLYLQIIGVSLPMMMQNFLSLASWLVFFLFVEKMGERELAISNIIRSFYMLLMIPMWGLSSAVNTLVSFLIGAKRQDEVMALVWKVMVLCLGGVGLMVMMGSFLPGLAIEIYTNNTGLIDLALPVVYVINIAAMLLSAAFIVFSAVSGTGKTQVSFVIEVMVLAIYLSYTYYMVVIAKGSISAVWAAECVYAILLGSLSFLYLKSGRWKGSVI